MSDKDEQERLNIERKAEIRRSMRRQRRDAAPDYIVAASRRIQEAVIALPAFQEARSIGCYMALPHEVQTRLLIDTAWEQEKRVCCPAMVEDRGRYELIWLNRDDTMRTGQWNIPEPLSHDRASPMDVDVMIVPALAYDRTGGRLGHGGGHFDRILGAWSGIKVGIAFEFQVLDEVPMGSQDIPVDLVVTERGLYQPEGIPGT